MAWPASEPVLLTLFALGGEVSVCVGSGQATFASGHLCEGGGPDVVQLRCRLFPVVVQAFGHESRLELDGLVERAAPGQRRKMLRLFFEAPSSETHRFRREAQREVDGEGAPCGQGGAARANVRFTQAQRDAAIAEYELAIQTAFREVAAGKRASQ